MTSEQVKAIRTELGMTQEGFAYALGTTFVTVNRWENGKSKPSKIWVRQIKKLKEEYAT